MNRTESLGEVVFCCFEEEGEPSKDFHSDLLGIALARGLPNEKLVNTMPVSSLPMPITGS